jgi:predicted transcriptional regulator
VRKLGEALKAVVSESFEAEPGIAARSPLMNANRRRAFEHVAWHPCCTASEVARALAVSGPTAAWHLRKLVEAGYLVEVDRGRSRAYYAAGLTLEATDLSTLAALANADAPRVIALVLTTPGLTGAQIAEQLDMASARRPLRALLAADLLVSVADGRYRRHYPGNAASALERTAAKRLREFRRRLLKRLERDRLAPESRTAPGDVLEVDVLFGDERATMRLPMASLFAGRLS